MFRLELFIRMSCVSWLEGIFFRQLCCSEQMWGWPTRLIPQSNAGQAESPRKHVLSRNEFYSFASGSECWPPPGHSPATTASRLSESLFIICIAWRLLYSFWRQASIHLRTVCQALFHESSLKLTNWICLQLPRSGREKACKGEGKFLQNFFRHVPNNGWALNL